MPSRVRRPDLYSTYACHANDSPLPPGSPLVVTISRTDPCNGYPFGMEYVIGVVLGVVVAGLLAITAPWWIPVVDPFFSAWVDWVDRRIKERGS